MNIFQHFLENWPQTIWAQEFLVLKKRISDFFPFFKETWNIISEFNNNFSENFFEILHISVGQKIKILKTHPDFLIFSAKTHNLSRMVKFWTTEMLYTSKESSEKCLAQSSQKP